MKLPFEFGPKLVFRLGLPGMVLGVTTAPLVFAFAHAINVNIDRLEVITLGTVFWGWAVSLSDMPIYMLYEGRRFWPRLIFNWGMNRERRRLAAIELNVSDDMRGRDRRLYLENSFELL